MIKSNKYIGVYKRQLINGDIAFVATFSIDNKGHKKMIGKKSEGMCESTAFLARMRLIKKYSQSNYIGVKKLTLNGLADKYFTSREVHSRSIPKIKKVYKYRIGELGEKELSKITSEDIVQFQRKLLLSLKLKKNTINVAVELLATIFNWGINNNYFDDKNPAKGLRFSKIGDERRRFLSEKEIHALFLSLAKDTELRIFTILALCTGARISTLYHIKKKDIDFDLGRINLYDVKNDSYYNGYVANASVKEELAIYTKDLTENNLIFRSKQKNIQYRMKIIFDNLFNKNISDSLDKVVIHTLRHTFASNLAISGACAFVIKKLMNHSSIKYTERYVKLSEISLSDAVKKLTFSPK